MHLSGTELLLSATDLSNFLSCRHLTALSIAVVDGKPKPPKYDDPLLEILFQRGTDHEKRYVELLRSKGRQIVDLTDVREPGEAEARTLDAMRSGADVIVQGGLRDGRTALRLARLFGTTPDFWLNLQRAWDLYELMRKPAAARISGSRGRRRSSWLATRDAPEVRGALSGTAIRQTNPNGGRSGRM